MIVALHSAENSAGLSPSIYSSSSSPGEGSKKTTPLAPATSASSASAGMCSHLEGGDHFGAAVVMDSLKDDDLLSIGGTGHWFHLVERILPYIVPAAKRVWKAGAKRRAQQNLMAAEDSHRVPVPSRLYIIFREEVGVSGLDAFCRFLLSSVFSGGYYDEVIIGHADEVEAGIVEKTKSGEGTIRNFHKHSTMFYPNADKQGETYTEVVYDRSGSFRVVQDMNGADRDHETVKELPVLCVNALMKVSWDNQPPKRYFLLGNDSDAYALLHASIENTCKLEPLPGANTLRTAARYLGVSRLPGSLSSMHKQRDGEEEDDLVSSAAYGGLAPPEEIAAEKRRRVGLPRDDLSRLPTSASENQPAEYALPHEGRAVGASRDDARDEQFTRKVSKWAAALADVGAVGWLAKGYNYNLDKGLLKQRYADAGTVLKLHENLIENHAREGGLSPAPVSTDVPLRVLVYDRDKSRRLQDAEGVVDMLREQMQLSDWERHLHFPVTYHSSERKPQRGPALGMGALREANGRAGDEGGERGRGRRKRGDYVHDQSSLRRYDHGHEKVAWTVELMTHNQHHAHNPHAGHMHDQRTGADTTIGASSARSGHTSTEHLPPCQVARAVREATVLVTPHGFQSILALLQPPKSLLVEVFPYGYNKPEIYGLIQAGMRAYRYGKQRSYLHAESPPTSLLPRLMHSLRLLDDPFINGVTAHTGRSEQETRAALEAQLWHLPDRLRDNETAITETMQRLRRVEQDAHREELYHTPGRWHLFSHAACTANPLCRHLAKAQDVAFTRPFARRVVEYAKAHYVNNNNKDDFLPEGF